MKHQDQLIDARALVAEAKAAGDSTLADKAAAHRRILRLQARLDRIKFLQERGDESEALAKEKKVREAELDFLRLKTED